jgi:hypothetical protein
LKGQCTTFLPPAFLPRDGKGLLVFEELNRCEKYMRAPCLQLLTARTLNDYQLPAGWLPVAAINPPNGDYETSELDPALLSRFVQVEVVPDRQECLEWARRSGVHAAVLNYVESDDTVFNTAESNPRAWHSVSDFLKPADAEPRPHDLLRAAVIGLVGDKRGAAFLRTLKDSARPLTADAILSSYARHQGQVRSWIETGRLDLVEPSLRAMLTFLQPKANYEMVHGSKRKWRNLGLFLADLPGDLQENAEAFFAERKYAIPTQKLQKRKAR